MTFRERLSFLKRLPQLPDPTTACDKVHVVVRQLESSLADAAALVAAGREPEPEGLELDPPRRCWFISEAELPSLPSARPIVLQVSAELVAAPNLALVPFGAG